MIATEQQLEQQQAALDEAQRFDRHRPGAAPDRPGQLGYTIITAPIAGRVGVVNADARQPRSRSADQAPLAHDHADGAAARLLRGAGARPRRLPPGARLGTRRARRVLLDPDSGQAARDRDARPSSIRASTPPPAPSRSRPSSTTPTARSGRASTCRCAADLGVISAARRSFRLVAIQQNDKGSFVFLVKPDKTVASTAGDRRRGRAATARSSAPA